MQQNGVEKVMKSCILLIDLLVHSNHNQKLAYKLIVALIKMVQWND